MFNTNAEIYSIRNNELEGFTEHIGKWYFNAETETLQIAWRNQTQVEVKIAKIDKHFNKIETERIVENGNLEKGTLTKMKLLDNRFDDFLYGIQDIPNDAIKCDFNGDGEIEFTWMINVETDNDRM